MSWKSGPVYPCNPWTARSEVTKLSSDPKGEKLVYTNGRAVVIRNINDPGASHVYTQHTQSATVARISPSGFYCASADVAGNVRIWDVTNPENVLKFAGRPLSGKINDLAWDGESKRIIVGGEGKDKFGAAFFMDSGSSCGEITGHSKAITCLSIRHQRPFRAVSGSDDNSVCLHTAVPFKYDKIFNHHTRFVRDVRYSPNGDLFASVSSDGKLFFYEGKTGEMRGEAARDPAETSSLMAASWAPDSSKIATAGADGVVAIWDATTFKSASSWTVGSGIEDQQNGIVWASENTLASVSLSGVINLFDPRESGTKWRKLFGPTKAITASGYDSASQTFYAGSFDGGIKSFSAAGDSRGAWSEVEGTGHSARIVGFGADGKGKVVSAGWDNRVSSISGKSFASNGVATEAQPTGVAVTPSATYIATLSGLEIHPSSGSPSTISGETTAVAASPSGDLIAYGVGKKLVLASVGGSQPKTEGEFTDNKGDILSIAFSPDGKLVAAGDTAGRIILVDTAKKEAIVTSRWTFHTGRVVAQAFSGDGKRLASAGMDESIYIWETEKVGKNTPIKNAHPGGVSGVSWTDNNTQILSSGQDACARSWTVPTA